MVEERTDAARVGDCFPHPLGGEATERLHCQLLQGRPVVEPFHQLFNAHEHAPHRVLAPLVQRVPQVDLPHVGLAVEDDLLLELDVVHV